MRFYITAALIDDLASLAISVTANSHNRFDVNVNTAFLFVNHQTGLFSLVDDIDDDSF